MTTHNKPPDNFYEKIRPRLHRRIGQELSLAARVLDLGCGPCNLVEYLALAYRQSITGVDISGNKFPHRRHLPDGSRFHCLRKDAAHLNFVKEQSIDAVVSMYALHEMIHPDAVLKEIHRILRPGGEVLIVDFPRGSLAQKLWNENYYRPNDIKQMMVKAGFYRVRVWLIERKQIIWARGFRLPVAKTSN